MRFKRFTRLSVYRRFLWLLGLLIGHGLCERGRNWTNWTPEQNFVCLFRDKEATKRKSHPAKSLKIVRSFVCLLSGACSLCKQKALGNSAVTERPGEMCTLQPPQLFSQIVCRAQQKWPLGILCVEHIF